MRICAILLLVGIWLRIDAASSTPEVAAPWKIELVAEAPEVRHPTVVCTTPDGRVFVAEDPMDISAPANARQGRILCFFPDGRRTVYATNLYAVFGLQYFRGKLFVLHNPRFTVFEDEGEHAGESIDLIESTHPNPWALDWNDHVPANFRLAMDGYFYLAVGDKGLYQAEGQDGRKVTLHGGGLVRIRPDGTGLEIYCTGVRNILDVALNSEDEIFTYDNTDEHGWMGRLSHMVDGGFYGYPWDFSPRRPYTLWMMHDFGAGAATGTLAYTEDALPAEYRDNLFLADFGKRQLTRVIVGREGGTFRVLSHQELITNPPETFRPVGIALSADGQSIYICDWAHRDTKADVQVGRLWKMTFTGKTQATPKPDWFVSMATGGVANPSTGQLLRALTHPAKSVRLLAQDELQNRRAVGPLKKLAGDNHAPLHARAHALWALARLEPERSTEWLLGLARKGDLSLRRQAIRALGETASTSALPVLLRALEESDASIRFAAATALGRTGEIGAVPRLIERLSEPDLFARYAVFNALNRIGRARPATWTLISSALEHPDSRVSEAAVFAMRETYDPELVTRLMSMAVDSARPKHARVASLRLLASLARQFPKWDGQWWAYHPALAPRPRKTEGWIQTEPILALLKKVLRNEADQFGSLIIELVREHGERSFAEELRLLFSSSSVELKAQILTTLAEFNDEKSIPLLARTLESCTEPKILQAALVAAQKNPSPELINPLSRLARSQVIDEAQGAIRVLGAVGTEQALEVLTALLQSSSAMPVQKQVVVALGQSRSRTAVLPLMDAWNHPETRNEAFAALLKVSDPRALDVYLAALESPNASVREQGRNAIQSLREEIAEALTERAHRIPPQAAAELAQLYRDSPLEDLFLLKKGEPVPALEEYFRVPADGDPVRGQRIFWDETRAACINCHQVTGYGRAIGPDLTTIGAQFSRADLLEHVLQPSKAVREGYQQIQLELKNDDFIAGLIKGETEEFITVLDAQGQLHSVPKQQIKLRRMTSLSLMPEGLHVGLSLQDFSDLMAYLESRKTDPRRSSSGENPPGFRSLMRMSEWREDREKRGHWTLQDGRLMHDGGGNHLWSRRKYRDFTLRLEWRWPGPPKWEAFPVINRDGLEERMPGGQVKTARVLDGGDSGVFLRGHLPAQVNLFCYPVGSGEFWDLRTDPSRTTAERRALTPAKAADRPIGDWNEMEITLRGDRVTVIVNGEEVISAAKLPDLPSSGPIGLQSEHGRIEFRNISIKSLR